MFLIRIAKKGTVLSNSHDQLKKTKNIFHFHFLNFEPSNDCARSLATNIPIVKEEVSTLFGKFSFLFVPMRVCWGLLCFSCAIHKFSNTVVLWILNSNLFLNVESIPLRFTTHSLLQFVPFCNLPPGRCLDFLPVVKSSSLTLRSSESQAANDLILGDPVPVKEGKLQLYVR